MCLTACWGGSQTVSCSVTCCMDDRDYIYMRIFGGLWFRVQGSSSLGFPLDPRDMCGA